MIAKKTDGVHLSIERMLDATPDLVFRCWTEAHHLERWGGAPKGMTAAVEVKEIRTGGRYRVRLVDPEGNEHIVQGRYVEVTAPERLVFTHAWIGEDGNPGSEMLVTITFEAVGKRTRMILLQEGFANTASRDGHKQGWSSQIDRFADYVDHIPIEP